ncbi:hypothetical protein BD769DRAFT_877955 [Suillus cothurnatus]|nr:hypothetical protein BD769DRAFT_877955 [Suillus cothurnatus]
MWKQPWKKTSNSNRCKVLIISFSTLPPVCMIATTPTSMNHIHLLQNDADAADPRFTPISLFLQHRYYIWHALTSGHTAMVFFVSGEIEPSSSRRARQFLGLFSSNQIISETGFVLPVGEPDNLQCFPHLRRESGSDVMCTSPSLMKRRARRVQRRSVQVKYP